MKETSFLLTGDSRGSTSTPRKTSLCTSTKRRYQIHVYPKGAAIVLLYCELVFSVFGNFIRSYSPLLKSMLLFVAPSFDWSIFLPCILLSYPVCGVIGEQFSRFKVITWVWL